MAKRPKRSEHPKSEDTVSFRLAPTFLRQLAAVAEERNAGSRHNLARQFVIDALAQQDVRPQLESLQEQVSMMRDDLVTAVAYALQFTGKLDAKEARRTAEQIFRKETSKE